MSLPASIVSGIERQYCQSTQRRIDFADTSESTQARPKESAVFQKGGDRTRHGQPTCFQSSESQEQTQTAIDRVSELD